MEEQGRQAGARPGACLPTLLLHFGRSHWGLRRDRGTVGRQSPPCYHGRQQPRDPVPNGLPPFGARRLPAVVAPRVASPAPPTRPLPPPVPALPRLGRTARPVWPA